MAPESLLDWSWALVYHINQTDRVVNDLVLVFRICNTCPTNCLLLKQIVPILVM